MSNCYDILEDSSDSDSDAAKPAVDKKAQGAAKGPASVNNKDSSSDDSDSDSDEPATFQKAKSTVSVPPKGHKWKKVQHDNTVTWLASWTENIQGQIKNIMFNPSSRLKGEKDWQKYEKARKLKDCIDKIREEYMADMKSKEMRIRQRAVALYFIDKLALRAGNEKDEPGRHCRLLQPPCGAH